MNPKEVHLLPVVIAVLLMLVLLLTLPGCSEPPVPAKPASVTAAPASAAPVAVPHGLDPQVVARGGEIYKANCAVCHGASAEGAPNWQHPGPDGKYPAPPLDGSGHAWHHQSAALEQTIRGGTIKLGGGMPAWGEKLSNAEIKAIVAWLQSLWPDEIYAAWMNTEMRTNK